MVLSYFEIFLCISSYSPLHSSIYGFCGIFPWSSSLFLISLFFFLPSCWCFDNEDVISWISRFDFVLKGYNQLRKGPFSKLCPRWLGIISYSKKSFSNASLLSLLTFILANLILQCVPSRRKESVRISREVQAVRSTMRFLTVNRYEKIIWNRKDIAMWKTGTNGKK